MAAQLAAVEGRQSRQLPQQLVKRLRAVQQRLLCTQ